MSRRGRAVAFVAVALVCAIAAAAIAGGYGRRVEQQLGALVPVVVARDELRTGRKLTPERADQELDVRRVPERFAPPGALTSPDQAVGLEPVARIPAQAYVLEEQLQPPNAGKPKGPRLGRGRLPVDVEVQGGGALQSVGLTESGTRVDVVVTDDGGDNGRRRTYVAAERVRLLDLREGVGGDTADPEADADAESGVPPAGWTATLALTRAEALEVIQVETTSGAVRLLPTPREK